MVRSDHWSLTRDQRPETIQTNNLNNEEDNLWFTFFHEKEEKHLDVFFQDSSLAAAWHDHHYVWIFHPRQLKGTRK